MTVKFASLGSGSSGNATIIAHQNKALMIDCGFSLKETEVRLRSLGIDQDQLVGILLTHEHGDHAKGVKALARKYQIPAYMSKGTALAGGFEKLAPLNLIASEQDFLVGDFRVFPITVPHDAREPLQFVIQVKGVNVGVLTDLGSFTPAVLSAYAGCDALLVEANHDLTMLAQGPYPPSLQRRVSGAWGHLNNHQTLSLLRELDLSRTQHVVVGHISQKNNTLGCVQEVLAEFTESDLEISFASQNEGFDWIELASGSF